MKVQLFRRGLLYGKDIPAYAIAGGHPAVPFKYRNIEHYNKMEKENRFH